MMYVRLEGNIAKEIIPKYATPPEQWYPLDFCSKCIYTEQSDVKQGYIYNFETGVFGEPEEETSEQLDPSNEDLFVNAIKEGLLND